MSNNRKHKREQIFLITSVGKKHKVIFFPLPVLAMTHFFQQTVYLDKSSIIELAKLFYYFMLFAATNCGFNFF